MQGSHDVLVKGKQLKSTMMGHGHTTFMMDGWITSTVLKFEFQTGDRQTQPLH
jgi:hypothetical protein